MPFADPRAEARHLRAGWPAAARVAAVSIVHQCADGAFGGLKLGAKRLHVAQDGRKLLPRRAESGRRPFDVGLRLGLNRVAIADRTVRTGFLDSGRPPRPR